MKTLYVFLLCLYTSLTVAAQPLCQIKHFSVNSGLSQGVVVNIMQDKKGFLWFATWNGLNKFDGYTFKNYKAFPGDVNDQPLLLYYRKQRRRYMVQIL